MVSKVVIEDWLEEGFLRFKGAPDQKVRHETSLIPSLTNELGQTTTPRPLFPTFLVSYELDSDFLVEYLEVIEKNLSLVKDKRLHEESIKPGNQHELPPGVELRQVASIEYERKNIFLSRVVFSLFELSDYIVPKNSSQYEMVLSKNKSYQRQLSVHQAFPEKFQDQIVQVGYVESDEKQIETDRIISKDKHTIVNTFEMKEHYDRMDTIIEASPKAFREFLDTRTKFRSYKEFQDKICGYPTILDRVKNSLYVIEKTLNNNTYRNILLSYNNCNLDLEDVLQKPSTGTTISSSVENIEERVKVAKPIRHLQFQLPSMKGKYRVTCVECNQTNPSIFVSGYAVPPPQEMNISPRGILLVWNIHKCEYPERIYHTKEGIACLEFSKSKPYLVAVGMRYGLVSVFDIRSSNLCSTVDNRLSNLRSTGVITSVRWTRKKYSLTKEPDILLSLSMDGVITIWNIGKSLDGTLLRTVKRGMGAPGTERRLWLAVDAAGSCLQLKPNDPNLFLVGTIEGQVLQGDTNDPEEYTKVYNCHNGPIHDLQWSPMVENVFVTCGSDKRVEIWEINRSQSSKSMITQDIALKLALSCMKSTLLAVMTRNVLYVYDLSVHLHKPLMELQSREDAEMTFVTFCPRINWILLGESDGVVNLYELANVPDLNKTQSDALKEIFLPEY